MAKDRYTRSSFYNRLKIRNPKSIEIRKKGAEGIIEMLTTATTYKYQQQPTLYQCGYKLHKPCKIWTGTLNHDGYGSMLGTFVHRLYYKYCVGQLNNEDKVLHKCHMRACYEEEHLYKGTQADNVMDMKNNRTGITI